MECGPIVLFYMNVVAYLNLSDDARYGSTLQLYKVIMQGKLIAVSYTLRAH